MCPLAHRAGWSTQNITAPARATRTFINLAATEYKAFDRFLTEGLLLDEYPAEADELSEGAAEQLPAGFAVLDFANGAFRQVLGPPLADEVRLQGYDVTPDLRHIIFQGGRGGENGNLYASGAGQLEAVSVLPGAEER